MVGIQISIKLLMFTLALHIVEQTLLERKCGRRRGLDRTFALKRSAQKQTQKALL